MLAVIRLMDACNLTCKMCDFVVKSRTYGQKMTLKDLRIVLEKLKGARYRGQKIDTVRLDGNREGLLYPQLSEAVQITKDAGFYTMLVTNGTILSPGQSEKLIASGLDTINFSISGITVKTYEEFQGYHRPGDQLSQVLRNVEEFVKAKKRLQAWTEVRISMLMNQRLLSDAGEYRKALLLYKKMGCDSLLLGNVYPKVDGETLRGGSVHCATVPIINVDGSVSPCCGGSEDIVLGNIFEDDADSILNGTAAYNLFHAIRGETSLPKVCAGCVYRRLSPRRNESFDLREDGTEQSVKSLSEFACLARNKKVFLFGANALAEKAVADCKVKGIVFEAVLDNDIWKWGSQIGGIPVRGRHGLDLDGTAILICTRNIGEALSLFEDVHAEKAAYAFAFEEHGKRNQAMSYLYRLN